MHHICVCQRRKNTFWNLLLDNFSMKKFNAMTMIYGRITQQNTKILEIVGLKKTKRNPDGSEINVFTQIDQREYNLFYTD